MSEPIDKAAEALRDSRERFEDALEWCLRTEQGRRLLFHIVYKAARLEGQAFTGEEVSRDYNLGQQSVGRWLLAQCEQVDADLADTMVIEGRRERRSDRVHSTPDASP